MRAAVLGIVAALASVPAAVAADERTPRPTCLRASDGARVVQFRAADRTRLLAVTMGRGTTGVVLAHHWRGSLCSWVPYARVLKARGFRVLAFDFRGHGLSGYPPYPRAEYLHRDVAAAARVLRGLGATRIVLAGESMGGTAVLHTAATLVPQPAAVVALSAPAVFGRLNGTSALSRLRIPVLLVAAENDDGFADEARQLLASAAETTTRLEIVAGGAHGADMLRAARVRDLVTAFVETHGRAASRAPSAVPPYRNPTAGSVLALQIRGMHRARVRRNLVYRRVGGSALRMDVYRPRSARPRRRLPAVLLGGPPAFRAGRESGQKIGWAQLVAASGLVGVAFDIRSDRFLARPREPSEDVAAALAYVRARAATLGIDQTRLCTLGFSLGTAPWHLWATMREREPSVRCNAVYYGPLDLTGSEFEIAPSLAAEFSALTYLRRDGPRIAPMFVAKAGRDQFAGINEAIDRFVAEARRVGADVRLETHQTGAHGFDVSSQNRRAREIMRATLAFFRAHLLR